MWNSLSENVVTANTLLTFERRLDQESQTSRYLDISVLTWTSQYLDISVLTWTSRYSVLDISVLTWTVRDLDETIFGRLGTDHNCLVLINCQYFCTSSSLIYDPKVDRYEFWIIPVQIDPGDRCFCILIFIYIFIILTSIYYLQK